MPAYRERAQELAKANEAMQSTTDALAVLQDMEEIVPAILKIIARTFDGPSAAYYEIGENATIYLRYFINQGRVVTGAELLAGDGAPPYDLPKVLAAGFKVNNNYTGTSDFRTLKTRVINHRVGTSEPALSAWRRIHNREMELNIPLMMGGEPFGALTLSREAERPYTAGEIELAETVAKQLSIAVQASRIAEDSRQKAVAIAIAKERENSAQARALELVEINAQLRDNLLTLAQGGDAQKTLQHILSTALKQLHAAGACVFTLDEAEQTLQITSSADRDVAADAALPGGIGRCAQPFPWQTLPLWRRFLAVRDAVLLDAREDEDAQWLRAEARQWHLDHFRPVVLAVPLAVANRLLGYLSITFPAEMTKELVSIEQLRMAQSLASLAAMTIETDRLAKRAQDAAIAEDRNRLAHELHDTLAGAFTGIFMQLQAASALPDAKGAQRRACILRAEELARNGLRQVREFVHTLTTNGDERWKTVELMRKSVSDATAGTAMDGTLVVEGKERPLKATVSHALQRILQEALGNAQRYARATNIQGSLRFDEDSVCMTIHDNGAGFDVQSVSDSGFGIPGMRTRVARLAGSFSLASGDGHGTMITVKLPEPYETGLQ